MTIIQLKALAREKGIKGYSGLNKESLIELIAENIEDEGEDEENEDELNILGITKLKEIAKELGISGYTKFKSADKDSLIKLIKIKRDE